MTPKQIKLFILITIVDALVVGQGVESWGWPWWVLLASGLCLMVIWAVFDERALERARAAESKKAEEPGSRRAPQTRAESIQLRATRVSSR